MEPQDAVFLSQSYCASEEVFFADKPENWGGELFLVSELLERFWKLNLVNWDVIQALVVLAVPSLLLLQG